MHLNVWINYYYPDNSWESLIFKNRLKAAQELYKFRKGKNQDLSLLECLQFCDKRDILVKSKDFLEKFDISKKQFYDFVKRAENIRNELAHSQRSIISSLKWSEFIETVNYLENFLEISDEKIEKINLDAQRDVKQIHDE